MIQFKTIEDLKNHLREWKQDHPQQTIGLVPTMGYLHEGHTSLVEKAKKETDYVIMTIFVNPLQFGQNEDYDTYPKDDQKDTQIAAENGVDILFMPTVAEMYPQAMGTTIKVKQVTEMMCGRSRPGHFDGVATVVMKFFQMIQPDNAYFGQKDAQQVAVIQKMVTDLNVPVNIVSCAIIREKDGLALSSRNVYLSLDERHQAPILQQTLTWAKNEIEQGARHAGHLENKICAKIKTAPLAHIDYVNIRTYPHLQVCTDIQEAMEEGDIVIALAVYFGNTRLIDNIIISSTNEGEYMRSIHRKKRYNVAYK